jgi:hypothetical protein
MVVPPSTVHVVIVLSSRSARHDCCVIAFHPAVSLLTMQGLGSDRFLLPRPPTRPEVSPPITSRYFGAGPIHVRQPLHFELPSV